MKKSILLLGMALIGLAACQPAAEKQSETDKAPKAAAVSTAAPTKDGYNVGDAIEDFSLPNVDGRTLSLADFPEAKGFIVTFTCNTCPYAVAWEEDVIALHEAYAPKGYPVIAINPNDPEIKPGDALAEMQKKNYAFPYLVDADQAVANRFGATRTPEIYVIQKVDGQLKVAFTGAIDNNHTNDEELATTPFTADAVDALLAGQTPDPAFTKAVGCSIKAKKM